MKILVGSRVSALAKAQVAEVWERLCLFYPETIFEPLFLQTTGDRDQKTSLRLLEKTDFFTKEIDQALLSGRCRIAIHSAKDLPEPLSEGIALVALTKGLDPSDALVLRQTDTLFTLPSKARIATSSERREAQVRALREDVIFCDIRGNIEQRLQRLIRHQVDGVVIAEAALIRLRLTHLNRLRLPGETAPYQGRLAVLARRQDQQMCALFHCLDAR